MTTFTSWLMHYHSMCFVLHKPMPLTPKVAQARFQQTSLRYWVFAAQVDFINRNNTDKKILLRIPFSRSRLLVHLLVNFLLLAERLLWWVSSLPIESATNTLFIILKSIVLVTEVPKENGWCFNSKPSREMLHDYYAAWCWHSLTRFLCALMDRKQYR